MDKFLSKIENAVSRRLTRKKALKLYQQTKEKTLGGEIWSWIDALLFAVFWVMVINQFLVQFFVIPSPSMETTLGVGDRVVVQKNAYGTEIYPTGPKLGSDNRRVQRDNIITFYNPEYESRGPAFDIMSQAIYMGTLSLVNIDRNPDGTPAERLYVKRAAAFPGDVVTFDEGNVSIKPSGYADFMPEDEFRDENGLSRGPHRSVDMNLYDGLKAFGFLKAYDERGILNQAPKYVFRDYETLPKNAQIYDFYEVDHQKARAEVRLDPSDMAARSELNKYENGIYVPVGHVLPLGDNRDNSRDGRYFGPVDEKDINGRVVGRFWPLGKIGSVTKK